MAMRSLFRCFLAAWALAATSLTAKADFIPLYVFAGQSNAVGVNTLSELTPTQSAPQPNVLYYGPNEASTPPTWGALTPSTTSPNLTDGIGRTGLGSYGPEISTGKTISAGLGGQLVAEVKLAVGATSLWDPLDWNPTGSNNLYSHLLDRVHEAAFKLELQEHIPIVAGFFWMQGESDGIEGHGSEYAANLTSFIAQVRLDFGNPNLPFVFGQIINHDGTTAPVIRAQQQLVADTVPNTALILTDDLGHTDQIHFNGPGIYTMGERFGAAYLSMVPEPSSLVLFAAAAVVVLTGRRRSTRQATCAGPRIA